MINAPALWQSFESAVPRSRPSRGRSSRLSTGELLAGRARNFRRKFVARRLIDGRGSGGFLRNRLRRARLFRAGPVDYMLGDFMPLDGFDRPVPQVRTCCREADLTLLE
jgi:hypothetical protein